jgi:hypothetical protein
MDTVAAGGGALQAILQPSPRAVAGTLLDAYASRAPYPATLRHNERPNLSGRTLGDVGLQGQGVKQRDQLIQSQAPYLMLVGT